MSICPCSGSFTSTLGVSPSRVKERSVPESSRSTTSKSVTRSNSPVKDRPEGSVTVTVGNERKAWPSGAPRLRPPRHNDSTLQSDWIVFGADALQIAGGRMAGIALAVAVEEGFTRLRVADQNVENFVGAAVNHRRNPLVQKRSDIPGLLLAQIELWHAFVGASLLQEFSKLLAVLVVHHEDRTDQVRAGLAAGRVAAVAEAALRDKHFLSALHGGLIEPWASSQGRRRIVRRRLFGSDQRRRPHKEGNDNDSFLSCHSLSPPKIPGYASLRACSLGWRLIDRNQSPPNLRRSVPRSGSYKFVFRRDCTLEAMRTQGAFSSFQGVATRHV